MKNPKREAVEHKTLIVDDTLECDECGGETHGDVAARWPTYPQDELCKACQRDRTEYRSQINND